MDLKQLIIFGIENSQEPEIKNPILRAALEGPRITAQEPRIIGKPGGVVEPGIEYYGDNVITYTGQGEHKGKYHLRLGADKKIHRGTKAELEIILKERKTAGGRNVPANLETFKYEKGFLTKKQFKEFLKKNHIIGDDPQSFAKNHKINTKPNPLLKNHNLYDTSQFTEELITTIQKKQVKTGQATKWARELYPPKTKSELHRPRYKAIVERGGIKKDSPFAGKAKLKVDLGHTGNIYGTERITGDVLAYTPKVVNLEMSKKGNIDHKIRSVSEKIEKIKKQKIPAAMKKELLEVQDAKLIRLASQSQGFKKVKLSDGSTFGGDKLTIDMFDEFPGKTEVEIKDFVNKWKDKKTWKTAEEFENIKKATLFEANRKSSLKAASKIGKKEQQKIITELNKKFIKIGCGMYAGGRVGLAVGSGKCITKAIAKLKSGNLTSAEKKIVDAMGDGLKASGMPKKFWTTALKGEGYFALADFANNLTKGQSLDKSFSNAIETASLGLIDLGGNERDLMKYAKERGLDTKDMKEWMDYAQTYGKYVDTHKDLEAAKAAAAGEDTMFVGPDDDMLVESRIANLPGKIKKLEGQLGEKEKSESIQSAKGYKDMNEMIEGVVAKEWNKPAGVPGLDRGYRKMLGMKGDEGLVWGPIGSMFREGMEKIGFDEHKAMKSFTPQTVMNYHPVYGYKEDIKAVIREGDSPMEDMLMYMEKNYPGSGLIQEALREVAKEKELEKWVDTGFGREKRKVKTDMGSYDYDPNLLATGGIASLMKKW